MKTFVKRSLTGLLFVIIIITAVVLGPYTFAGVFFIFMLLALYEFYKPTVKKRLFKGLGFFGGSLIYIILFFNAKHHLPIETLFVLFPVVSIILLSVILYKKRDSGFTEAVFTFAGLIYVAIPFSLLIYYPYLLEAHYNYYILLGFLILIWSNDTFAYITGSLIGRHTLYKEISPKKTWEGTIGGILYTIAIGVLLSLFYIELHIIHWIIISLIIGVFGNIGDLVESAFKRNADIKDSGNILPGHGGVLDRFDALIFTTPFVFLYLYFI
jgi:phosphatidate cytidylyltransferase